MTGISSASKPFIAIALFIVCVVIVPRKFLSRQFLFRRLP